MSSTARRWLTVALCVLAVGCALWAWWFSTREPYAAPGRDAPFWRRRATSPDNRTRAQAYRQLTRLGDRRSVARITEALREDKSGHVRAVAAECLGKFRGAQHVPALKAALSDKDSRVSDAAIRALGETGGKQAFEALVGAISEENKHKTVMVVAFGLPQFKTMESENALIQLLDYHSAWVRWRTIRTLGRIGTQRCVPRLRRLEGDPLARTDYASPKFKKHEIRGIVAKMLADAIEAASKRPPWPAGSGVQAKGDGK